MGKGEWRRGMREKRRGDEEEGRGGKGLIPRDNPPVADIAYTHEHKMISKKEQHSKF